ncbi:MULTISPECIES: sensor histidine kinase [Streptomyces]|uniref:histidine kinase n=1 Tax=Streptomyces xinghaiensis TaxID=1038928 RepID=A0A454L5N8_9ACTN|nr:MULTISPECIES: nitrate- and nitrite sensing domain-containing protein [Streptomyces]RKM97212.1 HAMP domain-containing protein [Streptomyces xinghaiensis]RNC75393.1 HAMP domain-containing protein [Streptomyces xinghaiensis]
MRPRGKERESAQTAGSASAPPGKRTTKVRNRLVVSVAVVAAAVAGAGAPAVIAASSDLNDSQRLVTLSELNAQAVVLAHSLADERDTMTRFVAAGRAAGSGSATGISEKRRASVDRRLEEIRENAPGALDRRLAELPDIRQSALTGSGPASETFARYTQLVQALHGVSADLARRIPPRAADGPADALSGLGRAVEQAAATRTLLLGALAAGGEGELTATAQRTRVQELAAVADFRQTAPAAAKDSYDGTVNGDEADRAERYLKVLTDQPQLSPAELALNQKRVDAALSGRIDLMRAAESALTTEESARLAALRDDDVRSLELAVGLLALCVLVAVGSGMSAARSMTRPLAVLRLGARRVAADPVGEEPVKFTGRNDEYAEAVAAVNELRAKAEGFHRELEKLRAERGGLIRERQKLADKRDELARQKSDLAERLTGLQDRVHSSFVNLSLRTLGLVERQLGLIEGLEERANEPEHLDALYKLDHLATRMRRHSENLLVLSGAEHTTTHSASVPLLDVLRASVSEIERYERVRIQSLPPHARVAGFAADALSHLVAELLENAAAFSPPEDDVELSGWQLENGEVMLSVEDRGIGMTEERLAEVNARLADPDGEAAGADEDALGLGLYVVARLAARHGIRVELRDQAQGGVTAVVVLPTSLLPTRPEPSHVPSGEARATGVSLPGSVAEANSNALPHRRGGSLPRRGDAAEPGAGAAAADTGTAGGAADGTADAAGAAAGTSTHPDAAEPAGSSPAEVPFAAAESAGPAPAAPAGAPTASSALQSEPVAAPDSGATPLAGLAADRSGAPDPAPAPDPAATGTGEAVRTPAGGPAPDRAPAEGSGAEPAPGSVPADTDTPGAGTPDDLGAHAGLARSAEHDPLVAAAEEALRAAEAEAGSPGGSLAGTSEGTLTAPHGTAADTPGGTPAPGTAPATPEPTATPATDAGDSPAADDDPYGIRRTGSGEEQHARASDDAEFAGIDEPTQSFRLPPPLPRPDTGPAGAPHTPDGTHTTGTEPGPAGPDEAAPGSATPGSATPGAPESQAAAPAPGTGRPAAPAKRLTDKGLPKRTPKTVAAQTGPVRARARGVDAEALRRKLGGFQQGSQHGRRDADAEIAEKTGEHRTGAPDDGGTVEEARG